MKRFVCFLLAALMVLGMLPMTAINANAASSWSTSEKAITSILTKPDRFEENAYGGGYIGYGTQVAPSDAAANAKYPDGITEDDAEVLLRDYLKNTVDRAINNFTATNYITLTQQQHDALAVFCMEMNSTAWLSDNTNPLREAVRTGLTGNDFLTAIANTGITNPENNDTLKVQMNLRLSVANLYLNADYAYVCPSKYTYVVLKNGSDSQVIAYDSSVGRALGNEGITRSDFLGWYLESSINSSTGKVEAAAVTKLNTNTVRKTLVAKYNGTQFNYKINSNSLISRYLFADAYAKSAYATQMSDEALAKLHVAAANTELTVAEEKMVDGIKWLKVHGKDTQGYERYNMWVYKGELSSGSTTTLTVVATATMNANLSIFEGATSASADTGVDIPSGTTVNIYEIKVEPTATGNQKWGKVVYGNVTGWINLANATVNDVTDTNNSPVGRTGTIVNTTEVNVRNNPGLTGTAVVTKLAKGTAVTILETTTVNNAQWGLVQWSGLKNGYTKGWVYMYYVNVSGLSQSQAGGTTTAETPKYTGVVTSNINLNVRKNADIYSTIVDELPYGTDVNIYEVKTNQGMKWGRIGTNRWVCMAYVDYTAYNAPSTDNSATTTTTSLQATVSVDNLSIYKNYNSNSETLGTLNKGDVLTVLERNTETTETGTRIWGRIIKDGIEGWINLAYVELKTVTTVTGGSSSSSSSSGATVDNAGGAAGMVTNCVSLNVRASAGVSKTRITGLPYGTAVKVYERVTVDSAPWARITWNNDANEGWVCMRYITLSTTGASLNTNGSTVTGTNSNTISATGVVNSNINLKVRSGAGLSYPDFDSLPKGTRVTIYQQITNDGMIWGQINTASGVGYICMSYVTVDSTSYTGLGVMGTIARCATVARVRSAPGTNNAQVGTVEVGKRVEVFETAYVGTVLWCRLAQGWVCGDYVLLDSQLAPGTALDATEATTEATQATTVPAETINRDNEVLYTITGTTTTILNVRNDADSDSDVIGSVNANLSLNILAVKNNGTELWGRIDQYATAGWVNMGYVAYSVNGYINTDAQPVYADPNTSSTVKGKLNINTAVTITKLNADTDTVYGWYEDGNLAGWVPMGRISDKQTEVLSTYKSSLDSFGTTTEIRGTTNAALTAYNEANGSVVKYYLNSGVTVYIGEIDLEYGKVWGKVTANNVEAWINLASVTYTLSGNTTSDLNVRKDKAISDDNVLGQIANGLPISVCELSFDTQGKLWGKVKGHTDTNGDLTSLNGGYVMMDYVSTGISIEYK